MLLTNELRIIFTLFFSFFISYLAIPSIIRVSKKKKLTDKPNSRKSHKTDIPTLGGLAIFVGCILALTLFTHQAEFGDAQYIIAAMVIILFIGMKDDILIIAPLTKLAGQFVSTIILVTVGDIRITNLHGLLGIYDIPIIVSIIITVVLFLTIINSFNFIDGIDGLAGGLGILAALILGVWFYLSAHYPQAILAISLVGATVAFLRYNIWGETNKIFMGDTGSMFIGLVVAVLIVKFNEFNIDFGKPYTVIAAPAISFAIIAVPLFDTLRVVFIRMVISRSLSHADRNHIHHRLLRLGCSHLKASLILMAVNVIFVVFAISLQQLGIVRLVLLMIILGMLLSYIPTVLMERKIKKEKLLNSQQTNFSGI